MKSTISLIKFAGKYWGLLLISGLSLLVLTGMSLLIPWLLRKFTAVLTENFDASSVTTLYFIAGLLLTAYLGRFIFTFLNQYLSHIASWRVVADLRTMVYDHFQALSLSYYQDKQTGQLMSRVVNDTAVLESMVAHVIPNLCGNVLTFVGVTTALFFINSTLAWLTLIPMPFILVTGIFFSKKVVPRFRKAQRAVADLNATLQDNFSGIREIQLFNQQTHEKEHINKDANVYTGAILGALRLSNFFHPAIEFFNSIGNVIVVLFGGLMVLTVGDMNTADVVGFLFYLSMYYAPIAALAQLAEQLSQGVAGAERVFEVLGTQPEITDREGAVTLSKVSGHIVFDNVSFSYNDDSEVLNSINLDIKPGQMVALVGPTGVGKTTTVNLIARFYEPDTGNIYIDGVNIGDTTLLSLRNNISMVLQDVFLFNGNIGDNIAYGCRGVSQDEIVAAARAAYIHDFIASLPEGYQTQIGERGVKLSGGQKQRISIARAILRKSPILILDEATASVDVETESEIQAAINALAGSRTIIIIAHRLSTVRRCDNIYVLENGRVVQSGGHEELLRQENGTYARLCAAQTVNALSEV